ncbi:MAG: hypothetical protein ACKO8U_15195 [Pirellula sp.]
MVSQKKASELQSGDWFRIYSARHKVLSVGPVRDGVLKVRCSVFHPEIKGIEIVIREAAAAELTLPATRTLDLEDLKAHQMTCVSTLCDEDWE